MDSGKGTVDTPEVGVVPGEEPPPVPVPVSGAAPLDEEEVLLSDPDIGGPQVSVASVELAVWVMLKVMVLIVALPLTIKLLLSEPVMASTLDVPLMGGVVGSV